MNFQDPTKLWAEVVAAESLRDSFMKGYQERLDRRTGPGYRMGRGENAPENHAHEWESLVLPRLVHHNPRVRANTYGDDPTPGRELEMALNQWARQTRLREPLLRAAVDFGYLWSVLYTSQRPRPGMSPRDLNAPRWPAVHRLSNTDFFLDPLCRWYGEARYGGHKFFTTKDDLIREAGRDPGAGWDPKAIAALKTHERDNKPADVPDRGEVCIYEVWCPGYEVEGLEFDPPYFTPEMVHGAILTVTKDNDASGGALKGGWLRAPRPYIGPAWGPYALAGAYIVPDCPFPLSPLAAVESQAQELNDLVLAANKSARSYKRLVICGSPEVAKKLTNSPHDWVITVPGIDKEAIIPVELGGIPKELVVAMSLARERLDRGLAMSEGQRGNADPETTATAEAIADASHQTRMAGLRQHFGDAVEQVFRTAAHYYATDVDFVMNLGEPERATLGVPQGARAFFAGGGLGASVADIDIELDVYSMGFTGESQLQRQMAVITELVTTVGPLVPTTPWVDWRELFRQVGEAHNKPDLASIIRPELALGAMGLGAFATGPSASGSLKKPASGGGAGGGSGGGRGFATGGGRVGALDSAAAGASRGGEMQPAYAGAGGME
jgi:hypothetical protein